MVTVQLYHPGENIPSLPPSDENALYFSPASRADCLERSAQHAWREHRHLFVATENGKLVAHGATKILRVRSVAQKGAIRLAESHASHRSLQRLVAGHTYEIAIDPSSGDILQALDLGIQEPEAKALARYPINPFKDLLDLKRLAVAKAFFSRVQRQPHIPFQFPGNGCQARAHEMCRLIECYLHPDPAAVVAKVWNVAEEDDLIVKTDNNPYCRVRWFYHVAPVVKVDNRLLVIDPALFEQPVTVERWLAKQKGKSSGPIYTSRVAYDWEEAKLFSAEEPNSTENQLRDFRDALACQISTRGPLPYSCARRQSPGRAHIANFTLADAANR